MYVFLADRVDALRLENVTISNFVALKCLKIQTIFNHSQTRQWLNWVQSAVIFGYISIVAFYNLEFFLLWISL